MDKQPASYKLPWLGSLAIYLATFVMCESGIDTGGCHLAVFSEDVAFARHFVATCPPPPSYPIGVLVVLTTPVKNHLKWHAIQLAIYSTLGA